MPTLIYGFRPQQGNEMDNNGREPSRSRKFPEDLIDTYDRIQQIQSREARQTGERQLRHWYAIAIIALLTLATAIHRPQ